MKGVSRNSECREYNNLPVSVHDVHVTHQVVVQAKRNLGDVYTLISVSPCFLLVVKFRIKQRTNAVYDANSIARLRPIKVDES
jgi:hypothetical protein